MSNYDHIKELSAFREEMREHMQSQTTLMRQMVELQTKHSHLELQLSRNENKIEAVEARIRPLEADAQVTVVRAKYNKDIIWFLLTVFVGIGVFAVQHLLAKA